MSEKIPGRSRRTFRLTLVAAFAITLTVGSITPAESPICIQAWVDEAMVLPDGSTHDPGRLRICLTRRYSPVAGIHEAAVDGRPVTMLMSRRIVSGRIGDAGRAAFIFRRLPDGGLSLLGYTVSAGDVSDVYWMGKPERSGKADPPWLALATTPEGFELVSDDSR